MKSALKEKIHIVRPKQNSAVEWERNKQGIVYYIKNQPGPGGTIIAMWTLIKGGKK